MRTLNFFNHSNEEISYRLNIDKESTNGVTVTILFFKAYYLIGFKVCGNV